MSGGPRTRSRIRPAAARPAIATPAASVFGSCRWAGCGLPVLWLAHVRTGRVAMIDRDPTPDGSVRVLLEDDGSPSGLYVVVPKADRGPHVGQLHTPHVASCGNGTARRLARDRAKANAAVDDAHRQVMCAAGCGYPLPEFALAAGDRVHVGCDPRYRREIEQLMGVPRRRSTGG